ncbi:MAG: hypothetical protein DWQ10_05555 [Calditrichaeota bacterium]|nr:MAG: hypothetical protein DWQ10_05555 [Calditrichota bacterium]
MVSYIDQIFAFLVIVIIVTALGLMYKSWLEKRQGGKDTVKKKDEIISNMLKKRVGDYISDFAGKNLEDIANVLAKDYSLLTRNSPYRIDGDKDGLNFIQKAMEEAAGQTIFDQKLTMINSDAAVVTFNWQRGSNSGKTSHVWRYVDGKGWELVHEHTSFNMPAQMDVNHLIGNTVKQSIENVVDKLKEISDKS